MYVLRTVAREEYSCFMPRKKTKLDIAAAKAAEIIQAHLETLPLAEAKAARREIYALAVRPSRSANREKAA